ncbi:hypothetical protein ABZP36_016640 [Zizania latifolia]
MATTEWLEPYQVRREEGKEDMSVPHWYSGIYQSQRDNRNTTVAMDQIKQRVLDHLSKLKLMVIVQFKVEANGDHAI